MHPVKNLDSNNCLCLSKGQSPANTETANPHSCLLTYSSMGVRVQMVGPKFMLMDRIYQKDGRSRSYIDIAATPFKKLFGGTNPVSHSHRGWREG
eukprot:1195203-Prorocentrum_minimum.AAC.7